MSQIIHDNVDVHTPAPNTGTFLSTCLSSSFSLSSIAAETGNHQHLPHSAQKEESRVISDYVDGSGPIFSLYLEMAAEEDKKMAENWKDDADGILIFVRRYCPFP